MLLQRETLRVAPLRFVGVVNGGDTHPFRVKLDFLGRGRFHADLLSDSPHRDDALERTSRQISSRDTLSFDLRRDGGYIACFSPIQP